jgi:hypothetical protein
MFRIDIYREPETDLSPIFLTHATAIDYLIQTNRPPSSIVCPSCGDNMNMIKCKNYLNGLVYSCKLKNCRKNIPIFDSFRIASPKIEISTYLLAVYKWIENIFEKDILRNLKISKAAYQ